MYLFFDTETTGFIKSTQIDPHNPYANLNPYPRIISISAMLTDENFNEVARIDQLVKPDGWEVPNKKFWIDNNYTTERLEKEGIDLRIALGEFLRLNTFCSLMVAHNYDFDYPILVAEFLRYGYSSNRKHKASGFCTMKDQRIIEHVGVTFKNNPNKLKFPKLSELHYKMFGIDFDGAHESMADVVACRDCLKELVASGVIPNDFETLPDMRTNYEEAKELPF